MIASSGTATLSDAIERRLGEHGIVEDQRRRSPAAATTAARDAKHVTVTRLDRLRARPSAAISGRSPQSVHRWCSAVTRRTVPELARMTMLSVVTQSLRRWTPVEQRAVGDPGGGENAVAVGHVLERVDALEVVDPPAAGAGDLVVVAEQQPALDLPADAAQRGRGEHAFGRSAGAHVDVDAGSGSVVVDDPGDVAVGDQLDSAAEAAQLGDELGVARPVEDADDDLGRVAPPSPWRPTRMLSDGDLREVDRSSG